MRSAYPDIAPFNRFTLEVDPPHRLYVEEAGAPGGIPVVFLHGGPGSGCNEGHRRYFDPSRYRVVLFDQRGCNRSAPRGATVANTTQDLLSDIECIRRHLGIARWMVFGGSWGATLALLYAQVHAACVSALVLRGVFLARQRDLDWYVRDGAGRMLPDRWDEFSRAVPDRDRGDLIGGYYRALHGADPDMRCRAARSWSAWSDCVTAFPATPGAAADPDLDRTVDQVRIETHYAFHRYFIRENQILEDAGRVPRVPIRILHGRRDLTCTPEASWMLHRALPGSELRFVADGGHLASEPAMTDALVTATDELAGLLA